MGTQLELFPEPASDRHARLAADLAKMRREKAARDATRPGAVVYARRGRHRFSTFDAQRFASAELDE